MGNVEKLLEEGYSTGSNDDDNSIGNPVSFLLLVADIATDLLLGEPREFKLLTAPNCLSLIPAVMSFGRL